MKTEKFRIKKADGSEIEIDALVGDNVLHKDVGVSLPLYAHQQSNYAAIEKLLTDLIRKGFLTYDKISGNQHSFIHSLTPGCPNKVQQHVNINPDQYGDGRTLEQMLFAVCQIHNFPAPDVIKPKNLLMRMYDRYMNPLSLEEQLGFGAATFALEVAVSVYTERLIARRLKAGINGN